MAKRDYSRGLEAALEVIGGKWKILIIWSLDRERLRFGELRRRVTGVSEKMLIQQLRELEADGVVTRKDFRENPPRVEYGLTAFGMSLKAAVEPLCDWGAQHMRRIGSLRS